MVQKVRGGASHLSYVHRIFRRDGYVRLINSEARVTPDSNGRPGVLHGTIDALGAWELPFCNDEIATASDGALMLGLRARTPDALAEAFRRHSDGVTRVVRRFLLETVNAEDIVQDVFESLYRAPARFDARRGTLSHYLNMQARSRCIDVGRSQASRQRRELRQEPFDAAIPVEDEALAKLLGSGVRSMLEILSLNERVPLELAYLNGLSYRAVAEHLGIPEGTVKTRIRSGLQRLRTTPGVRNFETE
jgi:RNA polymerase sigma-70 factor (ECF subfamily)